MLFRVGGLGGSRRDREYYETIGRFSDPVLRVGQSISSHSAANILGMVDTLGNAKRCKTIFRILKSLNGCFSDLVRGVISVRQCGKYHAYPEYLTTIAYTSSP